MKLLRRLLIGFIVLLVGLIGGAFAFDAYASPRVLTTYPPTGDILTVGGLETHVICQGEGDETVILFHGFAGGAIDMLPLMETLQPDLRVCSFDRLGNDYSSALPDDWTLDEALAWHNAVITQLSEETPYIAGHSLGGGYALAYAAQYPTQGVISLDGLSPEVADSVVGRMGTYSSLTVLGQIGLLRPLGGLFVSPDYETELSAQMTALRSRASNIVGFAEEGSLAANGLTSEAFSEAVSALDVPLLIFAAEQTDLPEGDAFHQALLALDETYAQSDLILIPDGRHYIIVTHAEQLAADMVAWINGLNE